MRNAFIALLIVVFSAPLWAGTPSPVVEAAQLQLQTQGYDPGPIDGLMGRRTRGALRRYQRSEGLAVSGRLDRATRAALDAATHAPSQVAPASPSGAAGTSDLTTPSAGAAAAQTTGQDPSGVAGSTATTAPPESAAPPPPTTAQQPPPPSGRVLSYRILGWQPPADDKMVLARFQASGDPPLMEHGIEELIVPDASKIYLLERGARVSGFDCEPGANRLSLNLLLGIGGPLSFRGLDEGGYCRIGFGILLEIGQILRLEPSKWGKKSLPGGSVRVGRRGLEYLR